MSIAAAFLVTADIVFTAVISAMIHEASYGLLRRNHVDFDLFNYSCSVISVFVILLIPLYQLIYRGGKNVLPATILAIPLLEAFSMSWAIGKFFQVPATGLLICISFFFLEIVNENPYRR